MRITRIGSLLLASATVVALAAACQNDDQADAASDTDPVGEQEQENAADDPAEVSALPEMTLVRSGGIAGVMETVTVAPDGTWSYAENKKAPETGELSEEEIEKLGELANDPRLLATADGEPGTCDDGFVVTLTVQMPETDGVELASDECGESPNEAFDAIVETLVDATPL